MPDGMQCQGKMGFPSPRMSSLRVAVEASQQIMMATFQGSAPENVKASRKPPLHGL